MESTGRITPDLRRLIDESYDTCRTCGSQLPVGLAAFAGYGGDGQALYVGECCRSSINELATHVYWCWESDKRVAPEAKLWRYVDLARFLSVLEHRALYFARADHLGDPFEAASGALEQRPLWDAHYLEFFRNAIRTVPGQIVLPSEEHVEREAARLLRDFSAGAEQDRYRLFVSCWHANYGESEALWRLYCPPPSAGVVIKTTAERLRTAVGDSPVELGRIQYVDFQKGFAGIHERIFTKRKSLSHEAEVRVVLRESFPQTETGAFVPVDLESLIVAVVPSPFGPSWLRPLLEQVLARYGVRATVHPSELLAEPFF